MVHFSVRPHQTPGAATTSGAATDSLDSEFSSNTTASGISQEVLNSHRGQTEEQQYHLHTSRGRTARMEEERREGSGHRRSPRQPDPPAYSVSSVRKYSRVICMFAFSMLIFLMSIVFCSLIPLRVVILGSSMGRLSGTAAGTSGATCNGRLHPQPARARTLLKLLLRLGAVAARMDPENTQPATGATHPTTHSLITTSHTNTRATCRSVNPSPR